MTEERDSRGRTAGLLFGLGAYGSWGLYPAFFPLLKPAGAVEILAHRIVWTVLLMTAVLMMMRRPSDLSSITRRTWLLLTAASALISVNWLVYVWAVSNGHVVDAALGYFINPLVTVLIGVLFFGERLHRAQLAAVLIAAAGVAVLTIATGGVPAIALVLALSFGLYGAVKKVVPVDPRVSVGVEAAIAAPFAIVFIVVLTLSGGAQFANNGAGHAALMILCGPVTAIPLLCFAAAAQRLPLVTLGLLQYMTPSLQMIWGVAVGHEPMPPTRWAGFALIWVALAVFSVDLLSRTRRARPPVPTPG